MGMAVKVRMLLAARGMTLKELGARMDPPTSAQNIGQKIKKDNLTENDLSAIARACGYCSAASVDSLEELANVLEAAKAAGQLAFIEVKCALGARADLGRPTTTPQENKAAFMENLEG